MKNLVLRALRKGAKALSSADRQQAAQSRLQAMRCQPWFRDRGDETLRLDYPLTPESVVFDLGGYEGNFASAIHDKYGCTVYVFEPIPGFYERIRERFAFNPKVKPFCVGLGDRTAVQTILVAGAASSLLAVGGERIRVQLQRAVDFIAESGLRRISLLKINIEGAEYLLLEDLLAHGDITIFDDIQIQFHDFVIPDAKERMSRIQAELSKTHELTYQYEFVWENWRRKRHASSD
jgi:FkbM family methyltransferase